MGVQIDEKVAREIATRSRGTPRLVVRLLEACHRYARSRGEEQISKEVFQASIKFEGLDELGLAKDEQRYLKYLADRDDPTRLTVLESALGIHKRTLQSVTEPFLLRCGLIEKSDKVI